MIKLQKFFNLKYIFFVLFYFTFSNVNSLENSKNEFGMYFGTKIYEERHPVDNSFFMSQDGWMIGINTNTETYDASS